MGPPASATLDVTGVRTGLRDKLVAMPTRWQIRAHPLTGTVSAQVLATTCCELGMASGGGGGTLEPRRISRRGGSALRYRNGCNRMAAST